MLDSWPRYRCRGSLKELAGPFTYLPRGGVGRVSWQSGDWQVSPGLPPNSLHFRMAAIVRLTRSLTIPRHQAMWFSPTIFLDCLVTNPDNEPELSLREAASFLLALIVFLALMSWMAMQWM